MTSRRFCKRKVHSWKFKKPITQLVLFLQSAQIASMRRRLFISKMLLTPRCPRAGDKIVLDLGPVHFVDSSGLGAIVSIYKGHLGQKEIQLCSLQPMVDKFFKLTRMDQVFSIFLDVPSAIHDSQAA